LSEPIREREKIAIKFAQPWMALPRFEPFQQKDKLDGILVLSKMAAAVIYASLQKKITRADVLINLIPLLVLLVSS
jgi:hypothetical protein